VNELGAGLPCFGSMHMARDISVVSQTLIEHAIENVEQNAAHLQRDDSQEKFTIKTIRIKR